MRKEFALAILACLVWLGGSAAKDFSQVYATAPVPAETAEAVPTGYEKTRPLRVEIPRGGLVVEVVPGGRLGEQWILGDGEAYSVREGESWWIYGHNSRDVFGGLKMIREGEIIAVENEAERQEYRVTGLEELLPGEIEKLQESTGHDLVLITCTGWADSKRLIVKARMCGQSGCLE